MFRKLATTAITLAALTLPGTAQAQNLGAELSGNSKYLAAGMPYSTGPATQLAAWMNKGPLTITGFLNYDHDVESLNERDIFTELTHTTHNITTTLGHTYMSIDFPGFANKAHEINVKISADSIPGAPSAKAVRNIDGYPGWYFEARTSQEINLGGQTITTGGAVAYNDHYWMEHDGFSHIELNVATTIPLGTLDIPVQVTWYEPLQQEFTREQALKIGFSVPAQREPEEELR